MAIIEQIEPPSSLETNGDNKKSNIFNKVASFMTVLFTKAVFGGITKLSLLVSGTKSIILVIRNFLQRWRISPQQLPHFAIVFLLVLVLVSNYSETVKADEISSELISLNPDTENSILNSVDGYTAVIVNDAQAADQIASVRTTSEGFTNTSAPVETQITARVEPLPDNSAAGVEYIIRSGDTLSTLAWKFGVKITTIRYLNDLENTDTIKPGSRLKVPVRGYEVPASQIALKAQKAKQAKQAIAAATRITVARSATDKRTYNGSYAVNDDSGVSLSLPVNYKSISRGVSGGHTGVDYAVSVGTPVMAAANGVISVTSTGWSGGYGNMIIVNHGGGLSTRYGHLSKISVSPGDSVSRGQVIGYSGSTGRSTGPHLHFEKIVSGHWVYFTLK